MLAEAREELDRADGKAGLLLSAILIAASVLGGAALAGDWTPWALPNTVEWLFWVGTATWLGAAVELAVATYPRIGRPSHKRVLSYYRHAAMHHDVEDLLTSLEGLATENPARRTADQLLAVSNIVVAKYKHIQRALWGLAAGGALLGAAAVAAVAYA